MVFNPCIHYYLHVKQVLPVVWYQVRCLGKIQLYFTDAAVCWILLNCLPMPGQIVHTFRVRFLCFKIRRHNLTFSGIAQETGAVQAEFWVRCLRWTKGCGWSWNTVEDGAERGQAWGQSSYSCSKEGWDLGFLNLALLFQSPNSWEVL